LFQWNGRTRCALAAAADRAGAGDREFEAAMEATRQMLKRVPDGQFDREPQEKSMTAGTARESCGGVADGGGCSDPGAGLDAGSDGVDGEVVEVFDRNVSAGREAVAGRTDTQLAGEVMVMPGVRKPMWEVCCADAG
jgi:hypothetical protein